jgi:predicted dehydrogenase
VSAEPDDDAVRLATATGWQVSALLASDVFDGLLWASRTPGVERNYVELAELLLDESVDAACLAAPEPADASTLVALLHAGLHVLVPRPTAFGVDALLRAIEAAEEAEAEHAVGLTTRWSAPAVTVADLIASRDVGPVGQVTARGWPAGAAGTLELIDVVQTWCGAVVAACASEPDLPAAELPGGAPVRWALLTEQATTVLVSPEGASTPTVRLSCPQGRLELTPRTLRWDGGGAVPLREVPVRPAEVGADEDVPALDESAAGSLGAVVAAHRLALAAATGGTHFLSSPQLAGPDVASLRDLFVAVRVRDALRASAVAGRWIETA